MDLIDKILICHRHLQDAQLPHAFGGALALAWCTGSARGTIDIDINVLVDRDQIDTVLNALPEQISWSGSDLTKLHQHLQHRLWWDHTPIDLFLNSTPFHNRLIHNIQWESFAGQDIPFLSCDDLAVFKVFFDRTKDWADLEAMQQAGTLNIPFVRDVIRHYLGQDDPRLTRLEHLQQTSDT